MATMQRGGEHSQQPTSREDLVAGRLLEREDLLELLEHAATKRVTVISAPPGSGKTSLLRAWARRSTGVSRVAFVSVERDQQDEQRFWSTVLDAIRGRASLTDPRKQPAATAALDADQLVDRVLSELAEQVGPVVLIIDDLHKLRSASAFELLNRLLAVLPRLSTRGLVVSLGSADQAAPAQARRRGRRDSGRRPAVHRARNARTARRGWDQPVTSGRPPSCAGGPKAGQLVCAWR